VAWWCASKKNLTAFATASISIEHNAHDRQIAASTAVRPMKLKAIVNELRDLVEDFLDLSGQPDPENTRLLRRLTMHLQELEGELRRCQSSDKLRGAW
jgi:hypothetical protein